MFGTQVNLWITCEKLQLCAGYLLQVWFTDWEPLPKKYFKPPESRQGNGDIHREGQAEERQPEGVEGKQTAVTAGQLKE